MATRVLGMFHDWDHANAAMAEIERLGYGDKTSVVVREEHARPHIGNGNGLEPNEDFDGAKTGAAIGGLAGVLLGVGALAIPGVGPLFIAGPIASVITSTLAGATVGALEGGLVDIFADVDGIDDDKAEFYAEGVRRGGIVVVADTDNPDDIRRVFDRNHVVDVDSEPNWNSDNWS